MGRRRGQRAECFQHGCLKACAHANTPLFLPWCPLQLAFTVSAALAAGRDVLVRFAGTEVVRLVTGHGMHSEPMVLATAAAAKAVLAAQEVDRLLAAQAAAAAAAADGGPGAAAVAAGAPSAQQVLDAQVAAAAAQAAADAARQQAVTVPMQGTVLGDLLGEPRFAPLQQHFEQGMQAHPVHIGDTGKHFKVGWALGGAAGWQEVQNATAALRSDAAECLQPLMSCCVSCSHPSADGHAG